jgi:hypothetical protein
MLPNNRQSDRSMTERCSNIDRFPQITPVLSMPNHNHHHNNTHSSHNNTHNRIRNRYMYPWVLREVSRVE